MSYIVNKYKNTPAPVTDNEESFGPIITEFFDKVEALNKQSNNSEGKRYTMYPIKDTTGYDFYRTMSKQFWVAGEIDFKDDVPDYNKLGKFEQEAVAWILASFAHMEGLINNNIVFRLLAQSKTMEESAFYGTQMANEIQHSESYSLMIDTLIQDTKLRNEYFEITASFPVASEKDKWLESFTKSSLPRDYLLLAYVCAEGVFFISGFLVIFWLRSVGLMKSTVHANSFIASDETLHRNFGIAMIRKRGNIHNIPVEDVHGVIDEAVQFECRFCDAIFRDRDELNYQGQVLKKSDIIYYLKYLAGMICIDLDVPNENYPKDPSGIPSWMNQLAMTQKHNFYETRDAAYSQYNDDESDSDDEFEQMMNKQKR